MGYNARTGVRDGNWVVDPEVVRRYQAMGIDALNDPAHADDAVARDIENNRMEFSQARNKQTREDRAAWNDANWGDQASAAGFKNWRQARRKAMEQYQADPVKMWQMAANGGGGNTSIQPTQDDLDRFSHWLWITNPANQAEAMHAGTPVAPVAPPAPPPIMAGLTPANIVHNNTARPTRPPIPGSSDAVPGNTNRVPVNTGFAQMGVQPSVLSLNPQSTATQNQSQNRRPPMGGIQTGYMKQPKRTTAQLGF